VESHSKECQKAAHSPRGWTLRCDGLRLNVALEATDIEAARREATGTIVAALEEAAGDVAFVEAYLRAKDVVR
jgi:hypothetical protein